jgi:fructose-1,6-bisphosphatase/inositol monophosphatase family enzyme
MTFSGNQQMLTDPNVWIADRAAMVYIHHRMQSTCTRSKKQPLTIQSRLVMGPTRRPNR